MTLHSLSIQIFFSRNICFFFHKKSLSCQLSDLWLWWPSNKIIIKAWWKVFRREIFETIKWRKFLRSLATIPWSKTSTNMSWHGTTHLLRGFSCKQWNIFHQHGCGDLLCCCCWSSCSWRSWDSLWCSCWEKKQGSREKETQTQVEETEQSDSFWRIEVSWFLS